MSTTTSSVNGEGATTSADDKKKSLEEKTEIAQRFDKEMKDYAKATVKEFLGIYGYEEDVDINIEDTGETPKSETTSNTTNQTVTATSVSGQPSSQSQDENISFIATTMSSSSSVEKGTTQHVTSLSISSSTNHPFREAADQDVWAQASTQRGEISGEREEKNVFDEPNDCDGTCRWCKKRGRLQSFTYHGDGNDVVYEGLCSSACFESVKRIRQGKELDAMTRDTTYFSRDNPMSTFSWDVYLAETQGTAAPWSCFKQSSSPPFNGFQTGMKLEAADPRNEGTVCVATVVGILGSRLRLRFDGCDNSNDIWKMVDSSDIHPIGWCEGNGGVLQPPVGFRWDVGKFQSFLTKTLANGELAPLRLFKKEPHPPKSNFFAPNHKLEAVDLKNPVLICVATVVEVVGDHIKIVFDGWKGSTKYTYRYDSRDIFPVGWCYFSGHPLQPPGPEYTKARKSSTDKHQTFSSAVRPLEVPGQSSYPSHSRGSPAVAKADSASDDVFIEYTSTLGMSRLHLRVTRESDMVSNMGGFQNSEGYELWQKKILDAESFKSRVYNSQIPSIELFVNHACIPGPYLDPMKVADLPQVFRGRIREVLQNGVQAIVDAAFKPKTVLGFLQPGRGKVVIKAQHGKEDAYTCCLQNVDRVSIFWNVIARFSDNLRCCKNLFSAVNLQGICPKCQNEGSKIVAKLRRDIQQEKCKKVEIKIAERGEPSSKRPRRMSGEEIDEDIGSTSSPTTWSTDEVVEYFMRSDISQYAEVFRDHEIDGGALLLLTRETIMSCMQFKLGPALKLLSHIDQLKARFGL